MFGNDAQQFGPYTLVRRLGTGGMAETFLAIRRGPGDFEQKVCVKRILPAFEEDPQFVRMFLREAKLSARVRHSNIAQVVDFGVVEESHFLTLELIEGMDLRTVLKALRERNRRLAPGLVLYIAFELARALEFAHAADDKGKPRGIVHRDISPSNILISYAGEVKLTDFGIAKAMNNPMTHMSRGIKGKIRYMAPEYATRSQFDARSDLFSLGVTLYECLASKRPFEAHRDAEVLIQIMNEQFTPLQDIVSDVPPRLAAAVEGLLCALPDSRPANAEIFINELGDMMPAASARRTLGKLVRTLLPPNQNASNEFEGEHTEVNSGIELTAGFAQAVPLAAESAEESRALDEPLHEPPSNTQTRLATPASSPQQASDGESDTAQRDDSDTRNETVNGH